jgi:hypothetical protein
MLLTVSQRSFTKLGPSIRGFNSFPVGGAAGSGGGGGAAGACTFPLVLTCPVLAANVKAFNDILDQSCAKEECAAP